MLGGCDGKPDYERIAAETKVEPTLQCAMYKGEDDQRLAAIEKRVPPAFNVELGHGTNAEGEWGYTVWSIVTDRPSPWGVIPPIVSVHGDGDDLLVWENNVGYHSGYVDRNLRTVTEADQQSGILADQGGVLKIRSRTRRLDPVVAFQFTGRCQRIGALGANSKSNTQ
jgi:hypothetical protein